MSLRIVITGSTGLIGSKLVEEFSRQGHVVTAVVRHELPAGVGRFLNWDPARNSIEADRLEYQDVVIHLAGANIAGKRWTPEYKRLILESRVQGTKLLSETLARLKNPPKVLLSASAVGFYGNDDMARLKDESSPIGTDFLADVCRQWEAATSPAEKSGIRVIHMRNGVVLGREGGALAKMLPIFQLGLGGKIGDGRQPMSWIALDELPALILFLIQNESIRGPVNFVAPQPVTNAEFTKILGKVIQRPVVLPVPAVGIKLLFGEMGQSLLIEGVHVRPKRLEDAGYRFRYPELSAALQKAVRG